MIGVGVGVGVGFAVRVPLAEVADLPNQLVRIDATSIVGTNGDHLATLTDLSGHSKDFTQGTDGLRPTLATSWAGGKGIAFSGTQYTVCADPILGGHTTFSLCWVGQFSSVVGIHSALFFGNNASGDGLDLNVNRNATAKFGVFVRGVAGVDSGTTSGTGIHQFVVTYDSAATPKWTMSIDGVAQTLTNNTSLLHDPTTRAVLGATDNVPNFGFAGTMGLLVVTSDVWSASTQAGVVSANRRHWPSLP